MALPSGPEAAPEGEGVVTMPSSLSARPELRMTLLPADPINESRHEARSSAIRSRAATSGATPAATRPEPAVRRAGSEHNADDAVRYANAGPDCYWPECG
jgi:hypothetical protein